MRMKVRFHFDIHGWLSRHPSTNPIKAHEYNKYNDKGKGYCQLLYPSIIGVDVAHWLGYMHYCCSIRSILEVGHKATCWCYHFQPSFERDAGIWSRQWYGRWWWGWRWYGGEHACDRRVGAVGVRLWMVRILAWSWRLCTMLKAERSVHEHTQILGIVGPLCVYSFDQKKRQETNYTFLMKIIA